jgi:CBS domain-containing protein
MQATAQFQGAQSKANDLHESVRSLLAQKGNGLWSISPEESVYEAIERMSEKHVGALVVLSEGHLAGIITERDYARKVILKGRQSRETQVREIMTAPVLFVTPDQTAGECMQLMTSRRVRHLPVVEAHRPVGMLSIGDLVNWIIGAQEQTIRHLHHYIAGSYPA